MIVHVDVERMLTSWIRGVFPAVLAVEVETASLSLAWVSNAERPDPPRHGEIHVIVRDDGGGRREILLRDPSIGLTVLGPTKRDAAPYVRAANLLQALIVDDAPLDPSTPIADVPATNGPYLVAGVNDEVRVYQTATLTLVGASR